MVLRSVIDGIYFMKQANESRFPYLGRCVSRNVSGCGVMRNAVNDVQPRSPSLLESIGEDRDDDARREVSTILPSPLPARLNELGLYVVVLPKHFALFFLLAYTLRP